MTKHELKYIQYVLAKKKMDEVFTGHGYGFDDIKDNKFQRLVTDYQLARHKLAKYVGIEK